VSRLAVGVILAAAVVCAAGAAAIAATSDHADKSPALIVAVSAAGLSFIVSGLIARLRSPANATGLLMIAVGFLWYADALTWSNNKWVFTAGVIFAGAAFGPFAQLILSFPSGQLTSRFHRWLVGTTWFLILVPATVALIVAPQPFPDCEDCPDSAIAAVDANWLGRAIIAGLSVAVIALVAVFLIHLLRRYRAASPPLRRALGPVVLTSVVALTVYLVAAPLWFFSEGSAEVAAVVFVALFGLVPLSFLAGVLRSKLARGSVAGLLIALGQRTPLRDALAEALGDPSLEVGYWLERESRFVDADGRTLEVDRGAGRATTLVEREGRRVAALVHDAMLTDDPELVHAVAAAAALALDNERLTAELRAQYQVLITAVNTSPALLAVLDTDGRIRNFNNAVEVATGVTDGEQLRGTYFWDVFIDPREREAVIARFEAAAPDFPPSEYENWFVNARGDELVIAWSSAPLHDESGRVVGIVSGGLDITERHRHAAELERERAFLNAIANNAPSLLALIDENGTVVERATNPAFERLLEYAPDETGGGLFWERYVDPAEADEVRQAIERGVAGGAPAEQDNHWVTRTGRRLLVAWSCTPLPSIDERTLFVISGSDITERERREQELRSSEARLRAAIEGSPIAIVEMSVDEGVSTWNPAAHEMFGWTPEEVLDQPLPIIPPEREAEFADLFSRTQRGEVLTGYETERLRKDGSRVDVSISAAPIRDSSGEIVSYMALYTDITERKQRELELQRERDFLDTVADAIPSLLVVVDTEAEIVEEGVNRMFSETFGWSSEEAVGRSFLELVDPEDEYAVRMAIAAAANGVPRTDLEARWLRQDGEARIVAWTATPLLEARERPLVLITGADVTEQRRQQEEIRASRARLVEAHELERRRLERNLHDGAQQRLVALAVNLRLIESRLEAVGGDARPILERAREELDLALAELRELARGIHPAVLTDRGLGAALEALAARAPVPVEVEIPDERLPEPVEAAVYYVASEALTNVAKYAKASEARVVVAREDGRVFVEVSDDGIGGADAARGTGLRGLSDRVSALDGRLDVDSPPGRGTRILAEIPLQEPVEVRPTAP
jgi:PAS domain S-box-containing protein